LIILATEVLEQVWVHLVVVEVAVEAMVVAMVEAMAEDVVVHTEDTRKTMLPKTLTPHHMIMTLIRTHLFRTQF